MAKQRNSLGICVIPCHWVLNEPISFEDYKKQFGVDLDEIFYSNGFKSSFTKILFVDTTNIQGALPGGFPIFIPVMDINFDYHQDEYPGSYSIFLQRNDRIVDGAIVPFATYALIIDYPNRQIITWED